MRTAIGATAVNIAKPTNLGVPMIHAFLDNIRYITIELNGLTLYDTRDDVPCDMDKWRETRAGFPARWPVVRLKRPTSETPGRRSEPHPFAKVGLSPDTSGSAGQRFIATSPSDRWRKPTRSRPTPRTFVLCRGAHRYRRRHPRTPLTLFLSWAQTIGVLLAGPAVVARTHHRSRLLAGARTYSSMSAGVISCGSTDRRSKKCRSRSASATGTSNSAPT